MRARAITAWILGGLAACAPTTMAPTVSEQARGDEQRKQFELLMSEARQLHDKVHRVGWPILAANAMSCPKRAWRIAAAAIDKDSYAGPAGEAAIKVYGLVHDQPMITYSLDPALKAGDFVLKANGVPTRTAKDLVAQLVANDQAPGRIAFDIIRDRRIESVEVDKREVCNYPILFQPANVVNAYADGDNIVFTHGMIRFTQTDEELAIIFGHELAHNAENHIEKKQGNQLIGILAGAILTGLTGINMVGMGADIGALAFSKEFESEADYVGLYYAARAGFAIKNAPHVWRRMAVLYPTAISHGVTHPDTATRFLALEQSVGEIEEKKLANAELMPLRTVAAAPRSLGDEQRSSAGAQTAGVADPEAEYERCNSMHGAGTALARHYCSHLQPR